MQLWCESSLRYLRLTFDRGDPQRWKPIWQADCVRALRRLTSLPALELECCELPPCPSALTGLQSLVLEHLCESPSLHAAGTASLDQAFHHLQQLTCLGLVGAHCMDQTPVPLLGLSRLQRLSRLWVEGSSELGLGALPAGGWQRSLHWLAAEWDTLAVSRQSLEGAGALECLHIVGIDDPPPYQYPATKGWALSADYLLESAWAWFKHWALAPPTLRQLSYSRIAAIPAGGAAVVAEMSQLEAASAGRLRVVGNVTPQEQAAVQREMLGQARAAAAAWQGGE